MEFKVVFNEDNPDVTIDDVADYITAQLNKMQWKTQEEEFNLLKSIVEEDMGGVFTVINENKVKADFSDEQWIPNFPCRGVFWVNRANSFTEHDCNG